MLEIELAPQAVDILALDIVSAEAPAVLPQDVIRDLEMVLDRVRFRKEKPFIGYSKLGHCRVEASRQIVYVRVLLAAALNESFNELGPDLFDPDAIKHHAVLKDRPLDIAPVLFFDVLVFKRFRKGSALRSFRSCG